MITAKEIEIRKAYNKRAESVDPGVGYRLLGPNETLQEGDEMVTTSPDDNQWDQTEQAGCLAGRLNSSLVYRRRDYPPPEAGEGYRLLTADEQIQRGDEWLIGHTWRVANSSVASTPAKLNQWRRERSRSAGTRYYRRPVPVEDKSEPNIAPPGKGFRVLAANDVVRKGDEFHSLVGWWYCQKSVGDTVAKALSDWPHINQFRRNIERERKEFIVEKFVAESLPKICEEVLAARIRSRFAATETPTPIAPGEGYRSLNPGEKLQFGDECWDVFSLTFKPAPLDAMGGVVNERAHLIRRKVDTAVQRELADLRTKVSVQEQVIKSQAIHIRGLKDLKGALEIEAYRGELKNLRRDMAFAKDTAENWQKNCGDAYAAQERADKEVASLTIDALARDKAFDRVINLLRRAHCRCISADCPVHGSYVCEDVELWEKIVKGS